MPKWLPRTMKITKIILPLDGGGLRHAAQAPALRVGVQTYVPLTLALSRQGRGGNVLFSS
jgi:hypothetical protein